MSTELQTHAQLAAAPGETSPPIVVRTDDELGLWALGECTQGGADGEAAVHLVMNAVSNQLGQCAEELRAKLLGLLEEAVLRAGRELFLFARRRGGDLGVGLEVLLRMDHEILAAHVGNGGIYLVRRDLLHRLARGRSPDPQAGPPHGARWDVTDEPVLLGRDSQVGVQTLVFEVWPGDHLALLSSGLAHRLADADIRTLLAVLEPDQAARGLLHMARERGAPGALGAYLARVPGQPDQVSESVVSLLPVLGKIPLLHWCNREDLLDVAAVARPVRITRGQTIFAEGELGNELYLLVHGDVSVVSGGTGVAHLGPGSTFGEMALLDQPRRSATVEALSDGELLVISREAFFTLLKANPNLAVKLLWNLLLAVSGNLRRTTALMSGLVSGTMGVELGEDDDPTLPMRRKGRSRPT
jgi:serine/threonine protein phosphatase PrpC